jgi:hypothetical protein
MFRKNNSIAFRTRKSIVAKTLAIALVSAIGLLSVVPAQAQTHRIRLENDSSYAIYHVYVSRVDFGIWGPDRLGDIVLQPGYYTYLPSLPLGEYDLKLVDEDGDECQVRRVTVGTDTNWRIDDSWLLSCEFHR